MPLIRLIGEGAVGPPLEPPLAYTFVQYLKLFVSGNYLSKLYALIIDDVDSHASGQEESLRLISILNSRHSDTVFTTTKIDVCGEAKLRTLGFVLFKDLQRESHQSLANRSSHIC